MAAPSTSPCACPHSRWRQFIGILTERRGRSRNAESDKLAAVLVRRFRDARSLEVKAIGSSPRVLLDASLAAMYSVSTRALNQAVSRNRKRFPADFMFQLTAAETARLRSQTVISNTRGGARHRPYVFTEQGVAMLSSVLRSDRAIAVNVEIMRAFVQLRDIARSNADLTKKLDQLERKYDRRFKSVFDAIRYLMNPPTRTARRPIGFRAQAINTRIGEAGRSM